MGKSAKFYKRPSRKEKEVTSVKKLVEPTISKKTDKKITVPTSLFNDKPKEKPTQTEQDVDMDAKPVVVKKKKEKEEEKPDYVDLFSGKKTYKKIPKKRK
ncbi:hypothetical protein K501DRAFT_281796 [Backusella circina FSU 941]|nr:hypothetical protein K501DRAFT_281796 [Backusella circina FSU 941]